RPFSGSFSEIASQHLFVAPTPLREKVPSIPPDVEQVVLTALTKDPQQRFGNVRAFATALEDASQTPGATVFAPPHVMPPPRPTSTAEQQANQQASAIYFAPTQMGTPPQAAGPPSGIATPSNPPAGGATLPAASPPATPPDTLGAFTPPSEG